MTFLGQSEGLKRVSTTGCCSFKPSVYSNRQLFLLTKNITLETCTKISSWMFLSIIHSWAQNDNAKCEKADIFHLDCYFLRNLAAFNFLLEEQLKKTIINSGLQIVWNWLVLCLFSQVKASIIWKKSVDLIVTELKIFGSKI